MRIIRRRLLLRIVRRRLRIVLRPRAPAMIASHNSTLTVFFIFMVRSLRDDNRVSRSQDDVRIDSLALEQLPIVDRDLLLLPAFRA